MQEEEIQKECLHKLCEAVEAKVERKMQTTRDYDLLAECIFQELHQQISPTTLKRIWGYLPGNVTPRVSTLDILAHFVGYKNWEQFCGQFPTANDNVTEYVENDETPVVKRSKGKSSPVLRILGLLCVLALIFLLAFGLYSYFNPERQHAKSHILKKGDTFATEEEYLKLFGIRYDPFDMYWFKKVPNYSKVFVWSPQYHHPVWHNDGDKQQLMPTINEYYRPIKEDMDTIEALAKLKKISLDEGDIFTNLQVQNHEVIRITFMKNLTKDSCYTFLGVYRVWREKSSYKNTLYVRIADECDPNNLEKTLELLQ